MPPRAEKNPIAQVVGAPRSAAQAGNANPPERVDREIEPELPVACSTAVNTPVPDAAQ
jgi:hypothetical protein